MRQRRLSELVVCHSCGVDEALPGDCVCAGCADVGEVEIIPDPNPRRRKPTSAQLAESHAQLLAAAVDLRAVFLDGCGNATRGPRRTRLVLAAAALDDAIAKAKAVPIQAERCVDLCPACGAEQENPF